MITGRATVHATVIDIGGRGILLHGPSGSGKSDLALRLIDGGAALVADDVVRIDRRGAWLVAMAPPHHADRLAGRRSGRLFVSGIGVVPAARHLPETRLSLAVHCLIAPPQNERGPVLDRWHWGNMALPGIELMAMASSTPAKLRLALERWGL